MTDAAPALTDAELDDIERRHRWAEDYYAEVPTLRDSVLDIPVLIAALRDARAERDATLMAQTALTGLAFDLASARAEIERLRAIVAAFAREEPTLDSEIVPAVPVRLGDAESLIARLYQINDELGWDWEAAHSEADSALLDYIDDERIRQAYGAIGKWYA